MKISERKERLRTRGIVPVSQEPSSSSRKAVVVSPRRQAKAAGPARKDAAKPAQRARWQPSPRFQIITGAAYLIFAPILLYENYTLLQNPHSKTHPGLIEFALPVVFMLFGAWWVYRGVQARRKAAASAASPDGTPAAKPGLAKGPS